MKLYIQQKLFILQYNTKNNKPSKLNPETSGFTILEVIVTTIIGLLMISGGMGGFMMIQEIVRSDNGKIDINQRLSSVLSTMGPDLQQMGEGLVNNAELPALEIKRRIITGTTQKTSIVTTRRTLLPIQLSACDADTDITTMPPEIMITSGSSDPIKVMDEEDLNGGCKPSQNDNDPKDGWPDNVKKWRDKRVSEGGTLSAYIYNAGGANGGIAKGEFFDYIGEDTDVDPKPTGGNPPTEPKRPTEVKLEMNSHTWQNNYNKYDLVYLIDDRTYEVLDNGTLRLTTRTGETFDVAEGIDRLEVTAILQKIDGTTEYKCPLIPPSSGNCGISDYNWSDVKYIEVKVVAIDPTDNPELARNKVTSTPKLKPEDLTMTQRFLPRNRLSF